MDSPQHTAPRRVAVVGGGISGLTAAYELVRRGVECTLVESAERLGGAILTVEVDGCLVEGGPDSFIAQKPWALELIRELGLGDEVMGSNDARRKTYVLRRGKLVPLPDGIQFLAPTKLLPVLTTRLLSPAAKLRLALEWLKRPRRAEGDRSIAEFVLDHYGPELNEYLAQPMLAGVYGGEPEQLSVDAVMPRFVELERRYGSISRGMLAARRAAPPPKAGGSLFLTLRGGMQSLTDALVARIEGHARRIRGEAVSAESVGGGWRLRLTEGVVAVDAILLAVPAWRSAEILRGMDARLSGLLASIGYGSSVTGALIYRRPPFARPLDGFGFLVPRAERRLLTACTWVNTKFDHRAPDDRAYLRAFLAGRNAEERLRRSDEAVAAEMHAELAQVMGFDAEPAATRLFRWERTMAQYGVGHLGAVREIEQRAASYPGLFLGGNGFDGIGVPDCIRRSRAAVAAMFGEKSDSGRDSR